MAYHHLPCHHSTAAPAAYYCHCYCATCTPCRRHHHPPPPPPDSYLHHSPHQPRLYSALSQLPQYEEHFQEHYFHEGTQTQPTISSLLRRIASLEYVLRRRSSQTSASHSLRDVAARTIQNHFRAFLSRRSRTLRQLKDLASIKSTLGILKSSVAEKTHFDYDVVYHKAMKLLLKLDSIQGDDPLIRNGKSSISKELNKFLNLIEGISSGANVRYRANVKKCWVSNGESNTANVKIGNLKRVYVEKMRVLAERIDKLAEELDQGEFTETSNDWMIRENGISAIRGGVQPKVKKSVRFVENGKVYKVLRRQRTPFLEEECSESIDRDDDDGELEDDLCREIGMVSKDDGADDEEEEVCSENGSSSVGEKESKSYPKRQEDGANDFVFSPPLPVKMNKRGHQNWKTKKVAQNV